MKLVAGARLRRAQERVLAARPYAIELVKMVHHLALHADPSDHVLLEQRAPIGSRLIVPVTSDRGLCGAFNANIFRRTLRTMEESFENDQDVKLAVIGRKGFEHFERTGLVLKYFPGVFHHLEYANAQAVGEVVVQGFTEHQFDEVILVYNEFKSAITQNLAVQRLLPAVTEGELFGTEYVDIIYEPSRDELLGRLLPRYIYNTIYRALLESWASEMGARMTAMDNATTNAEDLIRALTLQGNKARQASITKELVELTTGVEALKG